MTLTETKLVIVPEHQIKWFDKNYGFINDDDFQTDGASWSMLVSNIKGRNDRFLNYNGNSNSLIEGFWLGYHAGNQSTINTQYFLDCCLMAEADAIELEFYEIASNINTLHKEISNYIAEAEYKLYSIFHPENQKELKKIFDSITLNLNK